MGYGLTSDLQLIAIGLFGLCALIASRELPWRWSIGIAILRVAIVIGYFAWSDDGSWNLQDDLVYTMQGYTLIDEGYSPLSILCPVGIESLHSLAGGKHILYIWWTFTWLWLLGDYYYAPIVANVLVTFLSGHMLSLLLREAGYQRSYRNIVVAFYLLHWDTIAWSSFLSLKDCLVQMMTISAFLFGVRCVRHKSLSAGIMLALILCLFQSIRFYVPALMAVGLGVWLLFESRDPIKILFFIMFGFVVAMLGPWHYFKNSLNPMILLYGTLRFILTPQPWAILPSYSFLYLPSLAHWIFFLPAMAGAISLFHRQPLFRLLAWYVLVLLLFYSAVDQLQGVRHRVQISFIFAWAQMHFILLWTHASLLEPAIPTQPANHSSVQLLKAATGMHRIKWMKP